MTAFKKLTIKKYKTFANDNFCIKKIFTDNNICFKFKTKKGNICKKCGKVDLVRVAANF